MNLDDIQSEEVKSAYIRGAYNNGFAHGSLGLPNRYRVDSSLLGKAWSNGWNAGQHTHNKK